MNKKILLVVLSCILLVGVFLTIYSDHKNNNSISSSASSSLHSSSVKGSLVSKANNLLIGLVIDNEINFIMSKTGATAVTIAIAKDGVIEYEKAYGFKDAAKTIPLKNDALMRTASIVKPVTAAALRKLAEDGVLQLSDHAFCTGNNSPCWLPSTLLSPTTDPRVRDITIQQLIEHKGGRSREPDPIDTEAQCKTIYGKCPPNRIDIVKYMMTLPLDYTPGSSTNVDTYSNFGYLVLGMIIEQASHMTYTEYVQNAVMAPLGIASSDFKAGASLPADHDSREPIYISTQMAPSVFNIGTNAPFAEEGFVGQNWIAVGSSISTAKTMALFASAYMLPSGERLKANSTNDGIHLGSVDGTSTIVRQLPSGVSYSIFINIAIPQYFYTSIKTDLDKISHDEIASESGI